MICATFEKSCLNKGGIYLIYRSLENFGIDLVVQNKGKVSLNKDYDLLIGFGHPVCLPPEGNYKRGMVYASPMLQSELSEEVSILLTYIQWLRTKKLDYLFLVDRELAFLLRKYNPELNIYWMPACDFRKIDFYTGEKEGGIVVGAFRSNKNYINQIMGMINGGETNILMIGSHKKNLYLIADFLLSKKTKYLDNFESYEGVLQEVARRKYSMQVSISESFCYAVYESCMLGTPSITSYSTSWYRGELINKYCLVKNIDSLEEISDKVSNMIKMEDLEYNKLQKEVASVASTQMLGNRIVCNNLFKEINK